MKEQTIFDAEITQILHNYNLPTFDSNQASAMRGIATFVFEKVLELEQTQSSRHDWSISVESIKKLLSQL